GRETLAPEAVMDHVADFAFDLSFDFLGNETDLSDGLARIAPLGEPVAVVELGVAPELALDPLAGFIAIKWLGVVAHHLGVAEEHRHEIEIAERHLAQAQPRGFENEPGHDSLPAPSGAGVVGLLELGEGDRDAAGRF